MEYSKEVLIPLPCQNLMFQQLIHFVPVCMYLRTLFLWLPVNVCCFGVKVSLASLREHKVLE